MVAPANLFTRLSLIALVPLVWSSPWHMLGFTSSSPLIQRQAEEEPASCVASCDLNTCGAGACGAGLGRLAARSFDFAGSYFGDIASVNVTGVENGDISEISKRIWRFDANSNTPVGDEQPTMGQVDAYLPAVFTGAEQDYFGVPQALFDRDERAVSREKKFEKNAFQIMTGGIHGCMTITLVSTKAVWMAHFWETYSHGRPNKDIPTEEFFIDRVIRHITGDAVKNPAPFRNEVKGESDKPYLPPTGDPPTKELFGEGTNPRLFISTPIKGEVLTDKAALKYQQKVSAIITAFRTRLDRKRPTSVILRYKPLNYKIPEEKALENKSHRGMHLFQYDPNSDGKGQAAWRLFAEDKYFVENL